MSDIFVSYAKDDRERAKLLADALVEIGWSVFWDREIPVGLNWYSHVGEALSGARCVVVCWSQASIKSDWVIEEAGEARGRRILIPVLLDIPEPPLGFRTAQALDISGWDGDPKAAVFRQLVGGVERLLGTRRNLVEPSLAQKAEAERQAGAEHQAEVERQAETEPQAETERNQKLEWQAVADIERYGISRVRVDYFHTCGYRYTKLEDAVAQAKRQRFPAESNVEVGPEDTAEMERLGITHEPVDHYRFGVHRYTSLEDAVAAAKRKR